MFKLKKIDEFRTKVMGQSQPERPEFPSVGKIVTDLALISEEYAELLRALASRDMVEVADAAGDLIVVITQLTFDFGIDIDEVLAEVHASNMTKVGGKFNKAGKFVKPDTYRPAEVAKVLFKQGWGKELKPCYLNTGGCGSATICEYCDELNLDPSEEKLDNILDPKMLEKYPYYPDRACDWGEPCGSCPDCNVDKVSNKKEE